jgi:hypothetical protein
MGSQPAESPKHSCSGIFQNKVFQCVMAAFRKRKSPTTHRSVVNGK